MRNYLFDPDEGPTMRRMMARLSWREMDREMDSKGVPASRTVWSSAARRDFYTLLYYVHDKRELVRIRHRYWVETDAAVLMVREPWLRQLERKAGETTGDGRTAMG